MRSFNCSSRYLVSKTLTLRHYTAFHLSPIFFSSQKSSDGNHSTLNLSNGFFASDHEACSSGVSSAGQSTENRIPQGNFLHTSENPTGGTSNEGTSDSTSSTPRTPPKQKIQVAIVGSGPSGCFVASALSKQQPWIHLDIFERFPVPFGLCRYGVSPDHPDVKNVQKQFMTLFKGGNVTWMGNITIGRDIPLSLLLQHYAAVVFTSGADRSGTLSVPGRDLDGVLTASDVVSNYNTVPFPYGSPRFSPICFERARNVSIIGNGNVALDIARYVSLPYKFFAGTDMNCYTIRALLQNRIHTVNIIGRNSVPFSSFTISSFRELAQINPQQVRVQVDPFDISKATDLLPSPSTNTRAHRRLMELIYSFSPGVGKGDRSAHAATAVPTEKQSKSESLEDVSKSVGALSSLLSGQKGELLPISSMENGEADVENAMRKLHEHHGDSSSNKKTSRLKDLSRIKTEESLGSSDRGPCTVRFRYNLSVERFLPQPKGESCRSNRLGGILLRYNAKDEVHPPPTMGIAPCTSTTHTRMEAKESASPPTTSTTGVIHPAFFVLPCDTVIQSIGYQSDINSVVTDLPVEPATGRILNTKGRVKGMPRVYCAGWAKNGPKGVIVHSLNDANETAKMLIEDMKNEVIPTSRTKETTMQGKFGLLDYFIAKQLEPVSIAGLERILHVEKERGIDLGKAAEKMDSVRDMLDVALGGEMGKKTAGQFRGITPTRAQPLMYLKELLDDETDLTDFAHSLAKDMPHRLAGQHPLGALSPSQL